MNKRDSKLLLAITIIFPLLISCTGGQTVVEPAGLDETLVNPGRGFATTHIFNQDIQDRLHPQSTLVQFRWYWDRLEPQEGNIDYELIDGVLARARENGQKLNFRVMCQNGRPGVPDWVRKAGAKGMPYEGNPDNWQPFYDDPVFLEKHAALIHALGARYDGHPDVDHVDIGTVGRWGEWHTGGTGMDMPSDKIREKIIDAYLESFKKTPLIMLIGGEHGLEYAISKGTGWRADCLGDMGGFNDDWNHMEDFYQQALDEAGANEAWKRAPVVFETCWTIQYWHDKGWDLDYILSEALRWHVSVLNNGSESIPEEWWPRVVEFEKKMGYRFVLKKLLHQPAVSAGGTLLYEMLWENRGVAPCYLNHPLAFEFRPAGGGTGRVVDTGIDITGWLPGPVPLQAGITVPQDLPPGEYELGIALLDPQSGKPGIRLAVRGRDEDGWYRLSRVRVR
ncbi:MAG: DUF4832 domain-containing protein [Candidatus Glassbacteria bacterium]|nr:DUF4832 domain-containing protein [Candidatus Glassbacteria bacterium]